MPDVIFTLPGVPGRVVTIDELIRRVRELSDLPTPEMATVNDFITNAEIVRYLDAGYTDLVDQLAAADVHLFEIAVEIAATGATDTFLLPSDHYKTLAVDYKRAVGWYEPLKSLGAAGRTDYPTPAMGGWSTHYRLAAGDLVLYPPPGAGTYRHTYVPFAADLTAMAGTDVVAGINGWEEWLVLHASERCLIKQDTSTAKLEKPMARMVARIAQMAADRQQPAKIVDVRRRRGRLWPGYVQ